MNILMCFLFLGLFSSTFGQTLDSVHSNFYNDFNRDLIFDSLSFKEGANEASEYAHFAIRSIGDPDHVSSCDYYAYKRYGVSLEMTGDIIIGNAIIYKNKGFNSVMWQRIRDSIPDLADSIGFVNPKWIPFDRNLRHEFLELFEFDLQSDSTVLITLNTSKVELSSFKSLDGVLFRDYKSETKFDVSELSRGVLFSIRGENPARCYLGIYLVNHTNVSDVCLCGSSNRIWLPVKIATE